jgi:TolB-like protein
VIRFAKEDISFATGKPLEEGDEFFQAVSLNSEKREDTLKKLFDKSVIQILDYSAITIPKESPIGILPAVSDKKDEKNAEYFSEQILLAFLANKNFKVVERKDMQKILAEWKLSMTGITEENANKFGQLTGAKFLCYSTMYRKEKNFEIFMKLVSTETGEVVSATKAVIELKLGL